MDDITIARIIHVLAVLLWIGGVAFVTLVVMPSVRAMHLPEERLAAFHRIEGRFAPQAKLWVLLAGVNDAWMAWRGQMGARFTDPQFWWMHAMVALWLVFAAMTLLRCVHPPSGAVALTAVLAGPAVAKLGYGFVLVPVGINTLVLTLVALAYNNATGRSYPHRAHPSVHPHIQPDPPVFSDADFDAVLADYGEALDIGRDDLAMLVRELLAKKPGGSS